MSGELLRGHKCESLNVRKDVWQETGQFGIVHNAVPDVPYSVVSTTTMMADTSYTEGG